MLRGSLSCVFPVINLSRPLARSSSVVPALSVKRCSGILDYRSASIENQAFMHTVYINGHVGVIGLYMYIKNLNIEYLQIHLQHQMGTWSMKYRMAGNFRGA